MTHTEISQEQIQAVAAKIAGQFKPEKIILFGSYAYGEPTSDSDIDLLVVLDFQGRGLEKALEIRRAVDVPFPCDLLAKTPEELERRYQEYDPIVRSAVNKGIVLYECDDSRVA